MSVVRHNQLLLWRTHVDRINRINRRGRQSVDRHNQILLWRISVDCIDRYQSIRSTVCWSTQSTHAPKNLCRTSRSLSTDTINSQLIDEINACSNVSRRSYDRYQSTQSNVYWSTQSTIDQNTNVKRIHAESNDWIDFVNQFIAELKAQNWLFFINWLSIMTIDHDRRGNI